jgi:hypothetical protein
MPWPIIVFARGSKNTSRVWPFYSRAKTATHESTFYMWPIYKRNRVTSAPLDRERWRILFFLYSDTTEKNMETGKKLHRVDFWPFFTSRKDFADNPRLQILSILEPLLPNSRSVEVNYSPIWSLWRSERNGQTGANSQSLLWNLYRRDADKDSKKVSLLFGLFQYESKPDSRWWRLFYVPFGKESKPAEPAGGM